MIFTPTIEGDAIVAQDIEKMKEVAEGRCDSLILFGSYGKGEGAIINGKPTNDYDLLIINPHDQGVARDLRKAVPLAECHLVNDGDDVFPSQQWWEIKYGSHVLLGKPLELPLWQPYHILLKDALRSLERRSVSLLVGKHEMMKDEPDYRKVIEQICKAIIAIGDAHLIKRGEFHPKYSMRALMLEGENIAELYQLAVSLKIFDRPDLNPDEIWRLWQTTRDLYRKYCTRNRVTSDAVEIVLSWNETMKREELEEVLFEKFNVERRWL